MKAERAELDAKYAMEAEPAKDAPAEGDDAPEAAAQEGGMWDNFIIQVI